MILDHVQLFDILGFQQGPRHHVPRRPTRAFGTPRSHERTGNGPSPSPTQMQGIHGLGNAGRFFLGHLGAFGLPRGDKGFQLLLVLVQRPPSSRRSSRVRDTGGFARHTL